MPALCGRVGPVGSTQARKITSTPEYSMQHVHCSHYFHLLALFARSEDGITKMSSSEPDVTHEPRAGQWLRALPK